MHLAEGVPDKLQNAAGGYKKHENHQNDARVQEIAQFATEQIRSKEGKELEFVKIQSVSTQVVAGKNYKLVIDLATKEQKVQPYEATVYEPLGDQKLQLTEHKAIDKANAEMVSEISSERNSGALLGGYKEIKSDDPEALEAAKFATKQLSQQSNSLQALELKQILAARSKVADTRSWALKLELSQGKQKAELYEVEVMQSLGHEYKLIKAEMIADG